MKANADNCHLLVSSDESCTAKIEDFSIKNSTEEKRLGVKFDSNLSFENTSSVFVKRQVRNYTLLQQYHIAWT